MKQIILEGPARAGKSALAACLHTQFGAVLLPDYGQFGLSSLAPPQSVAEARRRADDLVACEVARQDLATRLSDRGLVVFDRSPFTLIAYECAVARQGIPADPAYLRQRLLLALRGRVVKGVVMLLPSRVPRHPRLISEPEHVRGAAFAEEFMDVLRRLVEPTDSASRLEFTLDDYLPDRIPPGVVAEAAALSASKEVAWDEVLSSDIVPGRLASVVPGLG